MEQYINTAGTDTFFTGVGQSAEAADLKNFPARLYQTTQGRWITPDPARLAAVDLTNPQTFNRYGYVGANPLANVDPTGLAEYHLDTDSDSLLPNRNDRLPRYF